MKNWLARLFGAAPRPELPVPTQAHSATTQALSGSTPAFDIDLAFHRLLAGPGLPADQAPDEAILDELGRLARQPEAAAGLVPRVPAVVPQLLRSLRDESMSAADLARQVAQDVTLVAEVIREVNSPYYRPATPVRTIEGALLLLGQNGLRMLLARVAFRPLISAQAGRLARQLAPLVWSQSEKCALAASLMAPELGANPFEAYLAGLMQNVGLVVALRLIDQMATAPALPPSEDFARELRAHARTLSSRIAAQWEFPPPVGHAILHAGQADAPPLAQALHTGDRLSRLRLLLDAGSEAAAARAAALPPDQQRILAQLAARED